MLQPKWHTMKNHKEYNFKYTEISTITELSNEEQSLVNQSLEALKTSYSPYSKFKVGAAALLENGEVILGSNQENGAYPSGLCAERVALFYAGAKYPGVPVKCLAVSAYFEGEQTKSPVSPCGACRQVMIETQHIGKKPMRIILTGSEKSIVIENSAFLLPFNFVIRFLSRFLVQNKFHETD